MVGVMAVMANSFKRTYAHTVVFSAPDPMADHCQLTHPLKTPRHSQASLTQSLVGTYYCNYFVFPQDVYPCKFFVGDLAMH